MLFRSNPGSLELLQDMGFQTFNNFWDESYDALAGNARLEAVFHLCLEIANWSIDKINRMLEQMWPILEHNRQHLKNLPQIYQQNKRAMYEQIRDIVAERQGLL